MRFRPIIRRMPEIRRMQCIPMSATGIVRPARNAGDTSMEIEKRAATNQQLRGWRERMGMTQREAAAALDLALNNYQRLERGVDWNSDRQVFLDRRTELACIAIESGFRFTHLPKPGTKPRYLRRRSSKPAA